MPKLTKRAVDGAAAHPDREVFLWDNEIRGFGLRVSPNARRTYLVQYRTATGRTRRLALGQHGVLTADQARRLAQKRLAEVRAGGDPSAERKAARKDFTVADLMERFLSDHVVKKKRSTQRDARYLLARHVIPRLGRISVAALGREDVGKFHHALRGTPFAANRAVALLSKAMNLAEKWGLRADGTNPCRHVERFAEVKRERFLASAELSQLGAALDEAEQLGIESASSLAAVRLLLLTGARAGEILGLRWEHVDFERGVLRLPDSKTGAKVVPLGRPALDLLKALQPAESPWVIPGRDPAAPLVNLNKAWRRIRKRAGLDDVRLHDLRRTAASAGASVGLSLETLGQLLGHTQPATTKRYAFLFSDEKREAADKMSERVDAGLRRKPALRVVQ